MSFFTQKRAIENASFKKDRRNRKRSQNADVRRETNRRLCRFEELEKRELLAADPISVGVVYAEQGVEALGDKFYVAWVGGEAGSTTLDSLTINLDKNGNGALDVGENFFDVSPDGAGVYSSVPFTVVDATEGVGYSYAVEDGGMTLTISFTNFKAGDKFVFTLDVDEYQTTVDGEQKNDNSIVEGGEFGGSVVKGIAGSTVSATFSSEHYQTETWVGSFVDDYDGEYERAAALSESYDAETLPFDLGDNNEGIWRAGVYAQIDLTPKPVVISGYVYGDRDVDCNYDLGQDDPLANVELTLVAKDGRTWTTTTDADGYYEFNAEDILPGEYEIVSQCDVKSPEGLSYFDFCAKGGEFGEKIDPLHIKIDGMQGGDVAPNNNFAKALIGTISGNVFEDRNDADGKNDGETWDGVAYPAKVELWRVDVDAEGNVVKTLMETQTVDAAGGYKFVLDGSYGQNGELRKLVEKTYELREIFDSADYTDGKDYVGTLGGVVSNDVFGDVYVGYGEHGYNYDFGELKLGSIAGNVFEDRNDNGVFDANEAGIAGTTVELYQWDGANYVKIAETTTDENGAYRFDDLDIEKEYAVKEVQPFGYSDGQDAVGSLGGDLANDYVSKIEIGWDQHGENYDFGELKLGSIAGNVFEDRNDDGVFDANEAGIAGVTVELYQWDGADYVKVAETKTAEDGSYVFENLDINRQYAVKEKQPEAYSDGKDAVGSLGGDLSNDYIDSIDVQWDQHGENYDFGELKLGSVSGYVYHDKNDDGVRDEGEAGISGVTVELYRLDGEEYVKIAETTTDENGFYKFDSLDIERTYAVKEIHPDAWDDGKDAAGSLGGIATNDKIDNIDVYWDAQGVEYDFGELLPLGSLSGYVYEDDNNDGVRDANEAPIKDVVISLYVVEADGTAKLVATQKTDENGFYKFDALEPDRTYIVRETQPKAYFDGKETVGTIFGATVGASSTNDEIAEIELPRRGAGIEYNFGELRPASISGHVYEDKNDNGVFDSDEVGIKGATLTLWILDKETGEYVATGRTVQTNANGEYLFDGLEPNRIYRVVETQPSGYYDGKDAVGSLGGEMKNDDLFAISVKPGDAGVDYDFGELPIPTPETVVPPNDTIPDAPGPSFPISIPSNYWGAAPTHFPYTFRQPYLVGSTTTLFGGGGLPAAQSWRLSVLNGGSPRSIDALTTTFGFRGDYNNGAGGSYKYVNVSWSPENGFNGGEWLIRGANGEILANYANFGVRDAKPVVGDWNGDGVDRVGLYVDGRWFLDRDGDGVWDEAQDLWAELGSQSDQPVSGDWDGDGKTDIGIFGPQWASDPLAISVEPGLPTDHNQTISVDRAKNVPPSEELFSRTELNLRATKHRDSGQVRVDLIDHVFQYGNDGDVALTGDWTGDGVTKIGVYRNGDWYFDMNGDGRWNDGDVRLDRMGGSGYVPVVGDFNGDGIDTIGLFSNGDWLIDVDGDRRFDASISFGQAGDVPVVGDFNGDGIDELAVYRPSAETDSAAPRLASDPVSSPVEGQVADATEDAALQR
ncbi:MAG: hypothetical protein IKU86_01395 [Thermoguttaceae bacterium]|nr:hypothetical protein [Thermoguttaceae bacterium]